MNISFDNMEQFKQLVVSPLIEAMEKKIEDKLDPLVKQVNTHEESIKAVTATTAKLAANQAKALVGWSILVMGVTLLLNASKNWLYAHIGPLFK